MTSCFAGTLRLFHDNHKSVSFTHFGAIPSVHNAQAADEETGNRSDPEPREEPERAHLTETGVLTGITPCVFSDCAIVVA